MSATVFEEKKPSALQQHFDELLQCLLQLGKEYPQVLVQLTEIAQPDLAREKAINILGKMFHEVPVLLKESPEKFQKWVADPTSEQSTLRLLLDLRETQQLLSQLSYLQLLHLTNNLIPPGLLVSQFEFFQKVQEIFQSWSQETLLKHHNLIVESPLHMERRVLLESEPNLPWEHLQFLIEMLKLPENELVHFQEWFCKLPSRGLLLCVKLLQMEPAVLLDLKQKFESYVITTATIPSNTISSESPKTSSKKQKSHETVSMTTDEFSDPLIDQWHPQMEDYPPTASTSNNNHVAFANPTYHTFPSSPGMEGSSPPGADTSFGTPSTPIAMNPGKSLIGYSIEMPNFQLRIARQPPSKTVYQRILKPFPSVMLNGTTSDFANSNLFVEAILLRSDSEAELPLCLEGNKIVRIANGVFATFKKLKILNTSQQQGTLFRLKFVLKKYVGNVFETITSATIISNPIEVFSHTLYLSEKQDLPAPPVCGEILPAFGVGGTRVAILGSNFVNGPNLKVKFGEIEVIPKFHEQGTLICTAPLVKTPAQPQPTGQLSLQSSQKPLTQVTVPVKVANDGVNYCDTKVTFTFVIP